MMLRRLRLTLILLLLAALLTGCRDERIIERLGFTRTVAFDLPPGKEGNENEGSEDDESGGDKSGDDQNDEMLKFTLSIPKAQPENTRILLTATAHSSKEARFIASRKNNRRIVSGQMRTALFGDRLAKRGLWKYIDTLVRDPSIGSKVNIVVVDGDANALLKHDYKQYPNTGEYIDDLVRNGRSMTEIPQSNLHTFARDFFDKGIDPVTPILKEGKQSLIVDGIALFRSDRYVGRIPPGKSLLFSFLRTNFATGEIIMRLPVQEGGKEETVMLSFVSSSRKIKTKVRKPLKSGEDASFEIDLKISGEVLEYTGKLNLQKDADQRMLETRMKTYVEKETQALIKEMQRLKTDPIGLGLRVRNKISYADWEKLDWNGTILPNVTVKVNADVKIKDIGKLQESESRKNDETSY